MKTTTMLTAATSLMGIVHQTNSLWDTYRNKFLYVRKISEVNVLYDVFQNWYIQQEYKARSMDVSLFFRKGEEYKKYVSDSKYFRYKGHLFHVSFQEPKLNDDATKSSLMHKKIVISSFTENGIRTIDELLHSLSVEKVENTQQPFMRQILGGSYFEKEIPNRPIDSVVLKKGQLKRIIEDIHNWKISEEKYRTLGLPYRRSYLLEGPPGTGKSSTVLALANYFKMNMEIVSLSAIEKDNELHKTLLRVQPNSIILIEDIDRFAVTHADSLAKDNETITLAGLLNALDGVNTVENSLFFFTTNYPEKLDETLTRSGRMDVTEHIGLADKNQVEKLFEMFYKEELRLPEVDVQLVPSDVVEIMKRNFHNPSKAAKKIKELCDG